MNIETYATHIAGMPLAVNMCCHVNRHISEYYRRRLGSSWIDILKAPFDREEVKTLKAGDYVYIDGIVYSARDAICAHKRMYDAIMESGMQWTPVELSCGEKGIVPIAA